MTLISTFNLEGERIERAGLALEGRERDGWKPSHLDVERDGFAVVYLDPGFEGDAGQPAMFRSKAIRDVATCPKCKTELRVMAISTPVRHEKHTLDGQDVVSAVAACAHCEARLGHLELLMGSGSLFGPDEDRAVLHGRPRVY